MPASIPLAFSDTERQLLQQTLLERYGRVVPTQEVEVDLLLDPAASQPTAFPALYWSQRNAEFVICKTAQEEFRAQFFYGSDEVFGTGIDRYDNLGDCIVSLLQVQADHEANGYADMAEKKPKVVAQPAITGDDYDGPLVI